MNKAGEGEVEREQRSGVGEWEGRLGVGRQGQGNGQVLQCDTVTPEWHCNVDSRMLHSADILSPPHSFRMCEGGGGGGQRSWGRNRATDRPPLAREVVLWRRHCVCAKMAEGSKQYRTFGGHERDNCIKHIQVTFDTKYSTVKDECNVFAFLRTRSRLQQSNRA